MELVLRKLWAKSWIYKSVFSAQVIRSITKYGNGPWIIFVRLIDGHKSSMTAMRIIDDDVETLLTLDMSMEEDTRRRSLIQQRTDRLLYNEAPCVSEAELHQYSGKQFLYYNLKFF